MTEEESVGLKERIKRYEEGHPRQLGIVSGGVLAIGNFTVQMLDGNELGAIPLALLSVLGGVAYGLVVAYLLPKWRAKQSGTQE